ncbi:hypothetical protein MMC22_007251 [Lobaria immixta]|nr:hypothetical protein [Lobaria immixta]
MTQFRAMVYTLIKDATDTLRHQVLLDLAVPAIPWRPLRDNPTNQQHGWSFPRILGACCPQTASYGCKIRSARARAPEILSIRHRNTSGGDYRDVFVNQGLIVFVIQYHKSDYYQWPGQDHSSVSTAGGGCSGDVLSMAGFAVSRAAKSYIVAAGHGIITNVARRLRWSSLDACSDAPSLESGDPRSA